MFQSKVYDQVVTEINTSLGNMLETGIFRDDYIFDHDGNDWRKTYVPETTMRKVARAMASELKRPFVIAGKYYQRKYDHRTDHGRPWSELPIIFSHAHLQVPRVKYMSPIINPLMLASEPRSYRYNYRGEQANAITHYFACKWISFHFKDAQIFDDYLAQVTSVPEMRAAILHKGKTSELERSES